MTKFTRRDGTARIGAGVIEICCGRAQQIWREITRSDVGVDGQIEFVERGRATGRFVAVQIKTGTSYIDRSRGIFRVNTDRDHFAYWSGLSMPAIAIVVDPRDLNACWIDLTLHCTPERIKSGPYTVPITRSDSSLFTPETLNGAIAALANAYAVSRGRAMPEPRAKAVPPVTRPKRTPSSEYAARRMAWNQMCQDFTTGTDIRIVASAGHRLAWYLPGVPPEFEKNLDAALHAMSDAALARALGGAAYAFRNRGEHVAEYIGGDLLSRVPNAATRIRRLVETEALLIKDRKCAVQILEMWAGEFLPELWTHVPLHEHTD